MSKQIFETQVEGYIWSEVIRWINRLALADCDECFKGEPFGKAHQCSGIDGINFERFHLLTFYYDALIVTWDQLEIKEIMENVRMLICNQMRKQGFTYDEINTINTTKNIFNYAHTDLCVNRVFNDLWIRNYQPLTDPHDHSMNAGGQTTADQQDVLQQTELLQGDCHNNQPEGDQNIQHQPGSDLEQTEIYSQIQENLLIIQL